MATSSTVLPAPYVSLLGARPRADAELYATVLRAARDASRAATATAWRWYAGAVFGALAAAAWTGTVFGLGARLTAAACGAAIARLVLTRQLRLPATLTAAHAPAPLRAKTMAELAPFFRLASAHPEVARVVWHWIRSGHPIRADQVAAAERYLAYKHRRQQRASSDPLHA
jgi:hypothetical protein